MPQTLEQATPEQLDRSLHQAATDGLYAMAEITACLMLPPHESRTLRLGSACALLGVVGDRVRAVLNGRLLKRASE